MNETSPEVPKRNFIFIVVVVLLIVVFGILYLLYEMPSRKEAGAPLTEEEIKDIHATLKNLPGGAVAGASSETHDVLRSIDSGSEKAPYKYSEEGAAQIHKYLRSLQSQ